MTVSSLITKAIYSGNGVTTIFPITFPYTDSTEIAVYLTTNLGIISKITTNLTVNTSTNQVTYPASGSPIASGYKLTIVRETALVQEVDLTNQGYFNPEVIEQAFDKLTRLEQELSETVDRCVKFPVDENPTATDTESFLATIQAATASASASQVAASNSASSSASSAADSSASAAASAQSAIDAAAASTVAIASHTSNTSNPHAVTKTQVGLANVLNLDQSDPANITQSSTYRFATDAEKALWNNPIKLDTYANLVTWSASAADGKFAFSTDTLLFYYISSFTLNEVAVMKTINGTITQSQKTVGTSAVRATVSGSAPSASRKKIMITPDSSNTGAIYLGGSGVTTANGKKIIGPDTLIMEWDASDYYLISDTAAQVVAIIEVA